jgi:putative endonuclease
MPATAPKKQLGVRGENFACAKLERQGMRVLERKWRCRLGEIDIVAADVGESGLRLVFCEVKSRCGLGFGHPLEAISVPDRVGYVDRGFAGAAEVLRAHLQEWPLAQ